MIFYVRPHDWWNQYHKLTRSVERSPHVPSATQSRKAAILLQFAMTRHGILELVSRRQADDALSYLEWMVDHGRKAFEAELGARKAEAELGA